MKSFFIFLLLLACGSQAANACATCGCMNPYLGILPYDYFSSLGLYYKYNTVLEPDKLGYHYNTLELRGTFYVNSRLSLYAVVPYTFATHSADSTQLARTHGIGDVTLLANYFLVQRESSHLAYRLAVRGGVRLPASQEFVRDDSDREFALGTGTVGYVGGLQVLLRYENIGLNASVNYIAYARNTYGYKVGSSISLNAAAFYRIQTQVTGSKLTLLPGVGIFTEHAAYDDQHGETVEDSGGHLYYTTANLDVYYRRFSLNASVQFPGFQHLNNYPEQVGTRVIAGISYAFGKRKMPQADVSAATIPS